MILERWTIRNADFFLFAWIAGGPIMAADMNTSHCLLITRHTARLPAAETIVDRVVTDPAVSLCPTSEPGVGGN